MSIIHEEVQHRTAGAEVTVMERVRGESVEDWFILSLRMDSMERITPADLCVLGRWLVEQGERIKREYTKTGKPKKAKP